MPLHTVRYGLSPARDKSKARSLALIGNVSCHVRHPRLDHSTDLPYTLLTP